MKELGFTVTEFRAILDSLQKKGLIKVKTFAYSREEIIRSIEGINLLFAKKEINEDEYIKRYMELYDQAFSLFPDSYIPPPLTSVKKMIDNLLSLAEELKSMKLPPSAIINLYVRYLAKLNMYIDYLNDRLYDIRKDRIYNEEEIADVYLSYISPILMSLGIEIARPRDIRAEEYDEVLGRIKKLEDEIKVQGEIVKALRILGESPERIREEEEKLRKMKEELEKLREMTKKLELRKSFNLNDIISAFLKRISAPEDTLNDVALKYLNNISDSLRSLVAEIGLAR